MPAVTREVSFGRSAPILTAIARLTVPATIPLMAAICTGSATDSLRVRLLSIAQHRQAPLIKAVLASDRLASAAPGSVGTASKVAPQSSAEAPINRRRSTPSRNTIHARTIVKSPSRLRRRAVELAGAAARPNMSRTGAATPPLTMTAASQGMSRACNDAS